MTQSKVADHLETDVELDAAKAHMIEAHLRARDIVDPRVLEAMARVPRERFVPPALRDLAYADGALPIGHGQTISQPYIVALMTQLCAPGPGRRVLEIGTGCGYQTAVLACTGAEVYTIEIVEALAREAQQTLTALGLTAHYRVGDGHHGWPEEAPFDAILVTAAPRHIPSLLLEQLAPEGRLVLPLGDEEQDLVLVQRTAHGPRVERITGVRFVPMTGGEGASFESPWAFDRLSPWP
jgi:protein-L-isoaspartate(D-aspartate) O-methyltransferase